MSRKILKRTPKYQGVLFLSKFCQVSILFRLFILIPAVLRILRLSKRREIRILLSLLHVLGDTTALLRLRRRLNRFFSG
jgi:hypothetical protein